MKSKVLKNFTADLPFFKKWLLSRKQVISYSYRDMNLMRQITESIENRFHLNNEVDVRST